MQELHLLSELIKTKINLTLSEPRIKTIRFKYSTKKVTSIQKINAYTPLPYIPKALTSKEQQALNQIEDPELSQKRDALLGRNRDRSHPRRRRPAALARGAREGTAGLRGGVTGFKVGR